MRRRTTMTAALLAAASLSVVGCTKSASKGYISVQNAGPLIERVADRHDAYIRADDSLTPVEQSTYLRSTESLRALMTEAAR